MQEDKFKYIDDWTEDDLLHLPEEESEMIEYKSSKASADRLKEKICVAASAFWNSGGGLFFAGIDDRGKIDGGIPESVGRQKMRDWVDQILTNVEPIGPYAVKTIPRERPDSFIAEGNVVLIISFGKSNTGPHMAIDKKYYIRAGAHSGPASHFIVEAIRSRRGLEEPVLRGIIREHPNRPNTEQLVVLALNDAVALDVRLMLEPLPKALKEHFEKDFPLLISAIDKNNSFVMDISAFGCGDQVFGDEPVNLRIEYRDLAGRNFQDTQIIDIKRNQGPLRIGQDISKEIKDALVKLSNNMNALTRILENK